MEVAREKEALPPLTQLPAAGMRDISGQQVLDAFVHSIRLSLSRKGKNHRSNQTKTIRSVCELVTFTASLRVWKTFQGQRIE